MVDTVSSGILLGNDKSDMNKGHNINILVDTLRAVLDTWPLTNVLCKVLLKGELGTNKAALINYLNGQEFAADVAQLDASKYYKLSNTEVTSLLSPPLKANLLANMGWYEEDAITCPNMSWIISKIPIKSTELNKVKNCSPEIFYFWLYGAPNKRLDKVRQTKYKLPQDEYFNQNRCWNLYTLLTQQYIHNDKPSVPMNTSLLSDKGHAELNNSNDGIGDMEKTENKNQSMPESNTLMTSQIDNNQHMELESVVSKVTPIGIDNSTTNQVGKTHTEADVSITYDQCDSKDGTIKSYIIPNDIITNANQLHGHMEEEVKQADSGIGKNKIIHGVGEDVNFPPKGISEGCEVSYEQGILMGDKQQQQQQQQLQQQRQQIVNDITSISSDVVVDDPGKRTLYGGRSFGGDECLSGDKREPINQVVTEKRIKLSDSTYLVVGNAESQLQPCSFIWHGQKYMISPVDAGNTISRVQSDAVEGICHHIKTLLTTYINLQDK